MSNATIIESESEIVLFSYSTPVAVFNKKTHNVYKTTKKHSRTTSKHINEFFNDYIIPHHLSAFNTIPVEQDELDRKFPLGVTKL